MNGRFDNMIQFVKVLLVAGLVAWGVFAWWQIRRAREAGAVLAANLSDVWPEDGRPQFGTRQKLILVGEKMQAGDFGSVAEEFGPVKPPTGEQKVAAQRFFAKTKEAQTRYIAVAEAAEALEKDGADVRAVRNALARALAVAVRGDKDAVVDHLALAEAALAESGIGGQSTAAPNSPETVTELVREIGCSFNIGRELMTEGHTAAEKLVGRASRHFRAKEYKQAAALLNLAGDLLGVEMPAPTAAAATITPKWFDEAAEGPSDQVTEAQATAAVELCETLAGSDASKPVATLRGKARRELNAGRFAEAYWWASVALNALDMTDEAIMAETRSPEIPLPETADEQPDEQLDEQLDAATPDPKTSE